MLNVVIIEGYVTAKIWNWSGDRCFRLASYRDPHLPQKPPPPPETNHDQRADYVTVRVPGGAAGGIPVAIQPGQRVRVHGFLGSRPWRRTLAEIARQAQGAPVVWGEGFEPQRSVLEDEVVDIVAERIIVLGSPQEEGDREGRK
jgi:hypothetical protein